MLVLNCEQIWILFLHTTCFGVARNQRTNFRSCTLRWSQRGAKRAKSYWSNDQWLFWGGLLNKYTHSTVNMINVYWDYFSQKVQWVNLWLVFGKPLLLKTVQRTPWGEKVRPKIYILLFGAFPKLKVRETHLNFGGTGGGVGKRHGACRIWSSPGKNNRVILMIKRSNRCENGDTNVG
jgi:hypothetical protein